MNVLTCNIPGLLILEPKVFGDARGFFLETWNLQRYRDAGIAADFVQDNVSFSRRGILRGLHFQNPKPQGKLLQVLQGEVFDVAVDIRRSSPTFGKWHGLVLSGENKRQFYIPPGFAHGFAVLSETAFFQYKCTEFYSPKDLCFPNGTPRGCACVMCLPNGCLHEPQAMELPRILLIGKIGQVGWELRRTLAPMAQVTCVDFPDIDLTGGDSIRRWVRETRPNIVINAAAYTAVDKAESEPDKAMKINGVAPGMLAEEAKKRGALLVHYSTDYVFDGARTEPYVETDAPNPLGAYGRTKLAGDEAVRAVGGAHLIFRLCWVYGARGQNFMLTMMRLAREREKLRVVGDQVGCPTWSRTIAETTTLALKQVVAASDPAALTGTYHLASSGITSWHGFADAIVKLMPAEGKKCTQVEAITTAEYPTPTKRPAYSVLSCDKLERVFGLRLPHWEESLKQVLET
jgi:dTDP-4-dehydrorhamnose reductase